MFSFVARLLVGLLEFVSGLFKTNAPKREVQKDVHRNEQLLGDNDPGTPV